MKIPFFFPRQKHTDRIIVIDQDNKGVISGPSRPEADAVITNIKGVGIGVHTADCVPLLFLDPRKEGVAAVHAGWRGTQARIAVKVVRKMKEKFGSDPGEILAGIGPSIQKQCYEVGEEVASKFQSNKEETIAILMPMGKDKWYLDLPEANTRQLKDEGVLPSHLFQLPLCTHCQPDIFYSYRGNPEEKGRQLSCISLLPFLENK